jgi:isocitrate/isopropylmalate dehydrogenase
MDTIKIAVIPGDGIGTEVMPEGLRVLEAAGALHGSAPDIANPIGTIWAGAMMMQHLGAAIAGALE